MMDRIYLLKNIVKSYDWGSVDKIPDILGKRNRLKEPQAELWMGAHPSSPSTVVTESERISLCELIDRAPKEILGAEVSQRYDGKLPFLFKILAAEKPLSIQAHPNKKEAEEGFARENDKGIDLDNKERNYKDDNHKPEIICALTEFWALNGFRKIEDIVTMFESIGISELKVELQAFQKSMNPDGLKSFFKALMQMPENRKETALSEAMAKLQNVRWSQDIREWIRKFHSVEDKKKNRIYEKDIGVLSPLFLNLIRLKPGEAMYLEAGQLHAYLHGVGVELMANSDNVLRGGLTSKHKDVPELLRILDFSPSGVKKLDPTKAANNEKIYLTGAEEFQLSHIEVVEGSEWLSGENRNIELLICLEGNGLIHNLKHGDKHVLKKGVSVMIPASVLQYRIFGPVKIYKATVPQIFRSK